MDPLSDEKVLASWHVNAEAWTVAVRERAIESRRLVTDGAVVDAVAARQPRTLLDLGCGEGWLTREFAARGVACTGVDAIPALIERAREAGGGRFEVRSYEDLPTAGPPAPGKFDAVVANFSLIGAESVDALVRASASWLTDGGAIIIQTLHPLTALADGSYAEGWRPGSWAGFSSDFTDPAPWYFRPLGSWSSLFSSCHLRLARLIEPMHPVTQRPASIIFVLELV